MDATTQRFAYRCTPLGIANSSGWDLILPAAIEVTWTGRPGVEDILIWGPNDQRMQAIVSSVFGHGVLTFHPGYLFRTSPGWALNVRGAPNTVKDGIVPLEGLVETEWLPFTFTMNWQFTRPGTVRFEAGESFCFITPVAHGLLDAIKPRLRSFDDEPDLRSRYEAWRRSRAEFQGKVAARDQEAVEAGWQKNYVKGQDQATGQKAPFHRSKRRLHKPV